MYGRTITIRARVAGIEGVKMRQGYGEDRKLARARQIARKKALTLLYEEFPTRHVTVLSTDWEEHHVRSPKVRKQPKPRRGREDAGMILRPGGG